jgi:hypothetical protein
MDSILAMWFAALHAPFELVGNFLDALETDARHYERHERRAVDIERDEEIDRLERRLAELRGR